MEALKRNVIFVVGYENEAIERQVTALGCSRVIRWPEARLHPTKHMAAVVAPILHAIETREQVVIATHSEAILNSIGCQIEERGWNPDDFAIVVANDEPRFAAYSREGYLESPWPFGFFAPIDD